MAPQHEHAGTTSGAVSSPADQVVVHGEGVQADRVDLGLPRTEARSRFGGVDPVAVLGGTMAALGTLLLLSALAGAVGRIGYEQGTGAEELSTAGLVAGLLVLGLSLLFGGYVTGRVARYEGKRNGLLTGLLFVLLTGALGAAASQSDRLRDLDVPRWIDADTLTVAALASAVTALIVGLGAAVLGGRYGAAYHRRVDDALLGARPDGLAPYPSESGPLSGARPTTTQPGR